MTERTSDLLQTEADSVRQWGRAYIAKAARLRPEQIETTAEFPSLGMDSAELLFMVSPLEDRFGLDLASDTTTEYPTLDALAAFIAGELAAKRGR